MLIVYGVCWCGAHGPQTNRLGSDRMYWLLLAQNYILSYSILRTAKFRPPLRKARAYLSLEFGECTRQDCCSWQGKLPTLCIRFCFPVFLTARLPKLDICTYRQGCSRLRANEIDSIHKAIELIGLITIDGKSMENLSLVYAESLIRTHRILFYNS
jgi:hypothetical protein